MNTTRAVYQPLNKVETFKRRELTRLALDQNTRTVFDFYRRRGRSGGRRCERSC